MRIVVISLAFIALFKFGVAEEVVTTKKCEELLKTETCDHFRNIAKKFHEKVEIVDKAITEAFDKNVKKAAEIIAFVKSYLVEKTTNFKCEDILTPEQCMKVKNIGKRLTLKSQKVSTAIKQAVVNGATQAKQVYNQTINFFLNDVKNLKCHDLISAKVCLEIRSSVKHLRAQASDITLSVKEAIINGAKDAKEIALKAEQYLKEKITCEKILPAKLCEKVRKFLLGTGVSLKKVNEFMKKAAVNGINKVTDLYKEAFKYITNKWTRYFGDRRDKRFLEEKISGLIKKLKEQFIKVANAVLDSMKVADVNLREYIKKALLEGNVKIAEVASKIKELLKKAATSTNTTSTTTGTNNNGTSSDIHIFKRSVRDQLVEALKTVHGKAKELIERILKLSKEKFAQLKDWIKKLKDNGINTDELEDDVDIVSNVVHAGTEEALSNIVYDALDEMENAEHS